MSESQVTLRAQWSEGCVEVDVGADLIAGSGSEQGRQFRLAFRPAEGEPLRVAARLDYLDASRMRQSLEAELTKDEATLEWQLPRGCDSATLRLEQVNKTSLWTSRTVNVGDLGPLDIRRRALGSPANGYPPQVKRASAGQYQQGVGGARPVGREQRDVRAAGQTKGYPPPAKGDGIVEVRAGFNQLNERLNAITLQLSSMSDRLQPKTHHSDLERLQEQVVDEVRRRSRVQQELDQARRGEAAYKQRVSELLDKHEMASTLLTDTQARVERLRDNTTAAAAEPLQKVLNLLRTQPLEAGSDPLSIEEVSALKDALTRVRDQLTDDEARKHVDKVLAELASIGDDPIDRACETAESGDVVGALRLAEQFLLNPPDATAARGRDAYSNLLRGLVRNLWRSQGATEFLARREWIDQALRVLGFDLLIPEVGKTFSHRLQQAVDKVPVAEGQARNSIVDVREPGFRDLDGNIVELAKVVIAKG